MIRDQLRKSLGEAVDAKDWDAASLYQEWLDFLEPFDDQEALEKFRELLHRMADQKRLGLRAVS